MDRKLQRHRADSLRQHGFLVCVVLLSENDDDTLLHPVHAVFLNSSTVSRHLQQISHMLVVASDIIFVKPMQK